MRIKISRPVGCLTAIFFFVLLLVGPFLVETLWNEYKLYKFASQLDVIDDLLGEDGRRIGALSERRKASGSGDYCVYAAFRQYKVKIILPIQDELRTQLDALQFARTAEPADGSDANFYYVLDDWVLAVMIEDGPWSTVFDIRCW